MSSTYQKLQEQIQALQAQAEEARQKEMQGALAKIHELVNLFGLTRNDVFPVLKRGPKKGQAVAAKYRDPEAGATWSGRGR